MSGVILVITTNSRAEDFIPYVREAVDVCWRSHPRRVFLNDGEMAGSDILTCVNRDFVPSMLEGVERIRDLYPGVTHVFHMLEDHAPLRPVDETKVRGVISTAVRRDMPATSFVTYAWPWEATDRRAYDDGLVRTWRRIDTVSVDGDLFARVPRDFFRYFQVQPTLWRLDYLVSVLKEATSRGITDPWGFEALRMAEAEQHYVADYRWPTVHHGFLARGAVNPEAIGFIDRRSLASFRRRLMKGWSGSGSISVFYLKTANDSAKRFARRLRRRIGRSFRREAGP